MIVRTDPGRPNSPRQKYALAKAGAERIKEVGAAMRANVYCGNLLWQSSLV